MDHGRRRELREVLWALIAEASNEDRVECTNTGAAGGVLLVSMAYIVGFAWSSMESDGWAFTFGPDVPPASFPLLELPI